MRNPTLKSRQSGSKIENENREVEKTAPGRSFFSRERGGLGGFGGLGRLIFQGGAAVLQPADSVVEAEEFLHNRVR